MPRNLKKVRYICAYSNRCVILILYNHDRQKNFSEESFLIDIRRLGQPETNSFQRAFHTSYRRHFRGDRNRGEEENGLANLLARTRTVARPAQWIKPAGPNGIHGPGDFRLSRKDRTVRRLQPQEHVIRLRERLQENGGRCRPTNQQFPLDPFRPGIYEGKYAKV